MQAFQARWYVLYLLCFAAFASSATASAPIYVQFGGYDKLNLTCTGLMEIYDDGRTQIVEDCGGASQQRMFSNRTYEAEFEIQLSESPGHLSPYSLLPSCFSIVNASCVGSGSRGQCLVAGIYYSGVLQNCGVPASALGLQVYVYYKYGMLSMLHGTISVSRSASIATEGTVRVATISWPQIVSPLSPMTTRSPYEGPAYYPEIAGMTSCGGGIVLDATVLQLQFAERLYPGQCPMQFMAHYSNESGVMAASLDETGEVKSMILATGPGAGELIKGSGAPNKDVLASTIQFVHMRPEDPLLPGDTATLPYPVGIAAFRGPQYYTQSSSRYESGPSASTIFIAQRGVSQFYSDAPTGSSQTSRLPTTWQDAAAIYRLWQEYNGTVAGATKLALRDDIPDFVLQGAPGIISSMQTEHGFNPSKFGPHMEQLPGFVEQFKTNLSIGLVGTGSQPADTEYSYRPARSGVPEARGASLTPPNAFLVPYGWEHDGIWAGIFYLPPVPSAEDWQQASNQLARTGDGVAFLVSGYWWVVKRANFSGGPDFNNEAAVPHMYGILVETCNGTLFEVDCYDKPNCYTPWRGLSNKLCHGSQNASNTMVDIITAVNGNLGGVIEPHVGPSGMNSGVPLVSFDQEIGGGYVHPCYSNTHGHSPGFGKWMWEGIRDVVDRSTAAARTAGRPMGLMSEQCSELLATRFATFWSRYFGEIGWELGMGRAIGAFSWVHHEYVTALAAALVYGYGQAGGPKAGFEVRAKVMANSVARGLAMVPFDDDVHPGPLDGLPAWQYNVTRAFFSMAGAGQQFYGFLARGRALRNPRVDCPTVQSQVPKHGSGGFIYYPWSFPAVSVGVFREDVSDAVLVVLASAAGMQVVASARLEESLNAWRSDLGVPSSTPERMVSSIVGNCTVQLLDQGGRRLYYWAGVPAIANVSMPAFSVRALRVAEACSRDS